MYIYAVSFCHLLILNTIGGYCVTQWLFKMSHARRRGDGSKQPSKLYSDGLFLSLKSLCPIIKQH